MLQISSRAWALSALSGLLQILPFPIAGPVPIWRTGLAFVGLVPLLVALISTNSAGKELRLRDGAALGYLTGVIWYAGNCYWIYPTMHLFGGLAQPLAAGILVLFCLYLGLYHALFALIITGFYREVRRFASAIRGGDRDASRNDHLATQMTLLLVPFAWVLVEFLRARITGFPWDLLGITQVDNPLLTRLAPITGAYGISFVIAAINALWLMPINLRERRHTRAVLTFTGVALILSYIAFARTLLRPVREGTSATATLVQENMEVGEANHGPQLSKKELLRSFVQLSLYPPRGAMCNGIPGLSETRCEGFNSSAKAEGVITPANLIVWPESPAPFQESDPEIRDALAALARAARAPLIVGEISAQLDASQSRVTLHNSAEFIDSEGTVQGRYDKMHLVPFGEYVPFRQLFFFAGSLLQDVGDFSPGVRRSVFSAASHRFGTFICYESIFGDEIRNYPKLGADVLVNISDDGWYGDTSAPWEHLNMVRMRAVENHRWVLRATNSGITAVIDPKGRVVESAPRHIRTSLHAGFNYEHDITVYARFGDWFSWICVLLTMSAFVLPRYLPRRVSKSLRPIASSTPFRN